jgi:hypothetical protein
VNKAARIAPRNARFIVVNSFVLGARESADAAAFEHDLPDPAVIARDSSAMARRPRRHRSATTDRRENERARYRDALSGDER